MLSNAFLPSFRLKQCCQTLFHLHFVWNDVVKSFFTFISFETTLSNAFSLPFHLKRCCQTLFHLHFIWNDVVKRFFTSISFETTLSNAFLPSFCLKRCCQKLFHLHYITIWYSFGLNNGRIILYDSFCYLKLSFLILILLNLHRQAMPKAPIGHRRARHIYT